MSDAGNGHNRRAVVLLSSIGHAFNDVYWFLFALVMPLVQRGLHLSYAQAGLLLTIYLTVAAVCSCPAGQLSDLYGHRLLLSCGFLVTAVGLSVASTAGSYGFLALALVITGIGIGTFHPVVYAVLNEGSTDKKGSVYGVFEVAGAAGVLATTVSFGFLMKALSWRLLVFGAGIPALILAWVFHRGYYGVGRLEGVKTGEGYPTSGYGYERPPGGDTSKRALTILFAGLTFRTLGITSIVNFVPTYLVDVIGMRTWESSHASTIMFLAGMLGAGVMGVAANRRSPMLLMKGVALATVPVVVFMGLTQNLASLMVLLCLLGICWLGIFPPQSLVITSLSSVSVMGRTFGMMMALSVLVNAFGPGLFGVLADGVGFTMALRFASIAVVFGGGGAA